MAEDQRSTFTYETSRHKQLMAEYPKLKSREEFATWGTKAVGVAAYMNHALGRVALGLKIEKERVQHESDRRTKQGIEMAIGQLEALHNIVKRQLDELVDVMERLPSGSVRAEYEKLVKPWWPTPDTAYLKVRVSKSGDLTLNGASTDLDALRAALADLAKVSGLVLYTRELEQGRNPPAAAEQVIRLIMENRLPIRLCDMADFSDAIDENGKLRLSSEDVVSPPNTA
jgi:hypothetical protein